MLAEQDRAAAKQQAADSETQLQAAQQQIAELQAYVAELEATCEQVLQMYSEQELRAEEISELEMVSCAQHARDIQDAFELEFRQLVSWSMRA